MPDKKKIKVKLEDLPDLLTVREVADLLRFNYQKMGQKGQASRYPYK